MAEGGFNPKQLAAVEEEARNLEEHERLLDAPLSSSEDLMDFATEAFNQYFRAQLGVGVSGFSQADKEEVLYAAAPDRDVELPLYALVRLYVDFCNRWPDVLNLAYGGSPADFREFRGELVPSLLATLHEVSEENGEPAVTAAIAKAMAAYDAAIEGARRAERAEP